MIDPADYSILVAHADVKSRYELAYALRDAGFQTVQAESGARALQFAPHVSAALVDLALPDVSGAEVCRILRSRPGTARMPIVSVSAAGVPDAHPAASAVADALLFAPVDHRALNDTFFHLFAGGGR